MVAARTGHLYFAPVWSAAADRLAYLDCHSATDPAHFAADLCIGHAGGTAHRVVTAGQSHWFGTSYGADGHRGGGSNMTTWIPGRDRITWTRLLPDSHADAALRCLPPGPRGAGLRTGAGAGRHATLRPGPRLRGRGGDHPAGGRKVGLSRLLVGGRRRGGLLTGAGHRAARTVDRPLPTVRARKRLSVGHDRWGAGFGRWLTA